MKESLFLFFACLLLIGGCSSTPKPSLSLTHVESTTIMSIDTLTILPITTDTKSPSENFQRNLQDIYDYLTLDFALKGYVLGKAEYLSESRTTTFNEIAKMTEADLAELGPNDSQYYLLCIWWKEADPDLVMEKDFDTERTGFPDRVIRKYKEESLYALIFDKKQKKIIWQNEAVIENRSFWYESIILSPTFDFDEKSPAINEAIRNLFSTIPEKPMN